MDPAACRQVAVLEIRVLFIYLLPDEEAVSMNTAAERNSGSFQGARSEPENILKR
jgi:hypothetical protein